MHIDDETVAHLLGREFACTCLGLNLNGNKFTPQDVRYDLETQPLNDKCRRQRSFRRRRRSSRRT